MVGPKMSVVIPYYNNDRTLRRCLESFVHEQTVRPHEVVIVDDGSTRPAAPLLDSFESDIPIRHILGDHGGQSRASNIGVRAAEGDVVVMTCADIVADKRFLEVHVKEHIEAKARGESLAVLGHIEYAPWIPMTPFMKHLAGDGPQFCFGTIKNPERVTGAMLYSPNFSVERAWMRRLGGFDELFPYGFQDTDFGIRMVQAGIRLVYRKDSLALHDHPNDLRNFVRRNRSVGRYLYRVYKRHPSLFIKDNLRFSLTVVGASPEVCPELTEAAVRYEAAYEQGVVSGPKHAKQLQALFERVLSVAFCEGAIEGDERLGEELEFHPDVWRAVRAREPVTHPAYKLAMVDMSKPAPPLASTA